MLIRMLMIVSSAAISLVALDVPLKDLQTLYIPEGKASVIEVPFEITKKKVYPFFSKTKKIKKQDESITVALPNIKTAAGTPPPRRSQQHKKEVKSASSSSSPVDVSFGKNAIQR